MRKLTFAIAAATLSVPAGIAVTATSATAAPIFSTNASNYETRELQRRYYDRYGNYVGPTWRGRDGRYRCRRSDGTTGLIVGGAAGALIGNQVAGRGDRLLGTVIGGAAGALLGREVDRRVTGRARGCR
jgi:outer membrane lipoprotein SlyB